MAPRGCREAVFIPRAAFDSDKSIRKPVCHSHSSPKVCCGGGNYNSLSARKLCMHNSQRMSDISSNSATHFEVHNLMSLPSRQNTGVTLCSPACKESNCRRISPGFTCVKNLRERGRSISKSADCYLINPCKEVLRCLASRSSSSLDIRALPSSHRNSKDCKERLLEEQSGLLTEVPACINMRGVEG